MNNTASSLKDAPKNRVFSSSLYPLSRSRSWSPPISLSLSLFFPPSLFLPCPLPSILFTSLFGPFYHLFYLTPLSLGLVSREEREKYIKSHPRARVCWARRSHHHPLSSSVRVFRPFYSPHARGAHMDVHNSLIHDPSLQLLPNHPHHQLPINGHFQHPQHQQHQQQQHHHHLEHQQQQHTLPHSLSALYHLPSSQSHLSCDTTTAIPLPPSLPSSTCIPSLIPPGVDPAHVDMRTFYPYQPNEVKHRKRTTRAQLKVLEDVFKRDTKPNAALRKKLASELEMTPRGVQVRVLFLFLFYFSLPLPPSFVLLLLCGR